MLLVMAVVASTETRTPNTASGTSAASTTAGVARFVEVLDGRVEEVRHFLPRLPEKLDEVLRDRRVLQVKEGGREAEIADTTCEWWLNKQVCCIQYATQVDKHR